MSLISIIDISHIWLACDTIIKYRLIAYSYEIIIAILTYYSVKYVCLFFRLPCRVFETRVNCKMFEGHVVIFINLF